LGGRRRGKTKNSAGQRDPPREKPKGLAKGPQFGEGSTGTPKKTDRDRPSGGLWPRQNPGGPILRFQNAGWGRGPHPPARAGNRE